MSVWPALLRCLLCLTLILNGSGAASAATRMQLAHVAHTPTHQMKALRLAMHAPAAPCREHAGMTAMPHEAQATAPGDASHGKSKHPSPDCCRSGGCFCACTPQAAFVLAWSEMPGAANAHDNVGPLMATAHPSPALPHLIRPPIGQAHA